MVRKGYVVLLSLILAACGGGGGGGGSPSPANVSGEPQPGGGGQHTPNMKSGVFTDAPVSGLRYVQGSHSGVTDEAGTFTYDSASTVPIVFSINNTEIGSARGGSVVTPFDLNMDAGAINWNRGLNVARLLISLDEDSTPGNGIKIPETLTSIFSNLPLDLESDRFSEDVEVKRLLVILNINDLVSAETAIEHLRQNPDIKNKLNTLETRLNTVAPIKVSWNDGLLTDGFFAKVEGKNGEKLFLFSSDNDKVTLGAALYVDAQHNSVVTRYDANGNVVFSSVNGVVRKVAVLNEIDGFGAYDLDHYRALTRMVSIDVNNMSIESELGSRPPAWNALVRELTGSIALDTNQGRNLVELASLVMFDIEKLGCSRLANCADHFLLSKALAYGLSEGDFYTNSFAFTIANLDPGATCVEWAELVAGAKCGQSSVNLFAILTAVNTVFSQTHGTWSAKLHTSQLSREADGLRFEYSDFNINSNQVTSNSIFLRAWPVAGEPPRGPWIDARIEYTPLLKWARLSPDSIYYELSLQEQTPKRMVFRKCEPDGKIYNGQHGFVCSQTDQADTTEKQYILGVMQSILKTAAPESSVVKSCDNGKSYGLWCAEPLDDVNYNEKFAQLDEYLWALTAGLTRYVRHFGILYTGPEANPPFYGAEPDVRSYNIYTPEGVGSSSSYFRSDWRGMVRDPGLRYGEGYFNLRIRASVD